VKEIYNLSTVDTVKIQVIAENNKIVEQTVVIDDDDDDVNSEVTAEDKNDE